MKTIRYFFLILCLLNALNGFAQTWYIGNPVSTDITATLDNGTLTISGTGEMANFKISTFVTTPWYLYNDLIKNIVIENGVTSIGNYAFAVCPINSITIPETVTNIGDGTFIYCDRLTSVTISDSLTNIGVESFRYCKNLTSISIPEGVKSIGSYAFADCSKLNSIIIPSSVTSIEGTSFYGCTSLVSIDVENENTTYSSENGVLFNKDKTILVFCLESKTGNYIIPGSVTSIGNSAFLSCKNLTSISIPSSVISIGNSTFANCSELASIDIPSSVKSIGDSAFANCRFVSIIIPDGVTSIADWTFVDCKALTSVTIPSGVKSIGNWAFYYCNSLTSIAIPESVTSIGNGAFSDCNGLTSVTIPGSVETIGEWAFQSCKGLISVTISNGVTRIKGGAFSLCENLTSINIPASVANIGSLAFQYCKSLTSIRIPHGITSIEDGCFIGCSSLSSITIPESLKSIGFAAFSNCNKLTSIINLNPNPISISWTLINKEICTVYVPARSKVAYQNSDRWKDFRNIIELPDVSELGVDVLPSDSSAIVVWQLNEDAEGYSLLIYADEKREELIYILDFDAGGQLVNITSLKSGNTEQAESPIYAHIIENLLSTTTYYYTLETFDTNNILLTTQSGEFTTTGKSTGTVETLRAISLQPKITGYYSITGVKLPKDPANGTYIITYDNGTAIKVMRMK